MNPTSTHQIGTLMAGAIGGMPRDSSVPPPMSDEEREARRIADVRERIRASRQEAYEAECPAIYRETDWSHPDLAPYRLQIDKIRNWPVGPKGILAAGPTGRGKTRALWDLRRRLACEEGRDVQYYYAGDWFNRLQEQIGFGMDYARGWVQAVARRPIVMLDDLGQEAILTARAEWAARWFFQFVELRHGAKLPLFVTTNFTADQLAARFEQADGTLIRRILAVAEPVSF